MRTLLISVALLSAAPAALEAQAGTVYYFVPQATRVLQDTSSTFGQRLARLFTRGDTTKSRMIAMLRDSTLLPVCAMPVHVPDSSRVPRMPVARVSPQTSEMPVANAACRNPLFKK